MSFSCNINANNILSLQNLLDLQIARNGLCWVLCFCRIRIAEMAVNRVLAVYGGERGGFAVSVWFACPCACGWENTPRSSRRTPLR